MKFDVDLYYTLTYAALALVIGYMLIDRIKLLASYSIPAAVVGGLLFAGLLTLVRGVAQIEVAFDGSLLTPLNIAFFTSVGLSADARALAKGGKTLVLFFVVVSAGLVMQNAIGVGLAMLFDMNPVNGLLAGSITLSGGHGTGAAWAGKFLEERNVQGAIELAVAAATYGLVAGGVIGGPLAGWLIRRHKLQGVGTAAQREAAAPLAEIPQRTLIETLMLMVGSIAVGLSLYAWIGSGTFTLPSFIWALLVGVAIRNLLSLTGLYQVDDRALDLLGGLSLSLFLSMIIMTLKLWELVDLAGPVLAILLTQTVAMIAFVVFVTFRVMGRNYDAALLATGHLGFSLGSTATAMVNVQSVAARFGESHLAFLVIPVMGAFLIDIANALIIQGFLWLPWFNG
ncbi:MAG: sodium/glutamate symporter [Burkholderiaceae bacterium]|nr:sodium/glutamate symporter [Burkholderiaceae bacterium]